MRARALFVLAVATSLGPVAGCRDHEPPPAPRNPPPRRVLSPAPGGVRPLPPHAIRADGVGPYRLGRPLGEILADLPSGPSIATLDIQGVVACSVVRAEDGAVLIAGEPQGEATFVAVVRPGIARTESGLAVGTSAKDLAAAIGPAVIDHKHARDPRLVAGRALPGARFLVEQDHVAAVMIGRGAGGVTSPAASAPPSKGGRGSGSSAPPDAGTPPAESCVTAPIPDAVVAAGVKPGAPVSASPWCTGDGLSVTAVSSADTITLVGLSDGKAHRLAVLDAPGLVFAAPIAGEDDRDDLAVVTERAGSDARVIEVAVYRWDVTKLVKVGDEDVYRLNAASARWIGARLDDLELVIELEARGDAVVTSGAMVSRAGGEIRDVAPLVPVVVSLRHRVTPEAAELDAGHVVPVVPDDARR